MHACSHTAMIKSLSFVRRGSLFFLLFFEAPAVFPKQPIVWASQSKGGEEADRRGRDQIVWKGRVINGGRRQREGKGSGDRFPPGLTQRDLERISMYESNHNSGRTHSIT